MNGKHREHDDLFNELPGRGVAANLGRGRRPTLGLSPIRAGRRLRR